MLRFFEIGWRTKMDGPGNRVIIYFQGCPLRCPWCHSPHSWDLKRAPLLFNPAKCTKCGLCVKACPKGAHVIIAGTHTINRKLCDGCGRCQAVCPNSQPDFLGGVLSLPTREMASNDLFQLVLPQASLYRKNGGITLSGGEALLQWEELMDFIILCKQYDISVCVESSFALPNEVYGRTADYVDYWLAGLRNTSFGSSSANNDALIIENLRIVMSKAHHILARYPLIHNFTTGKEEWERYALIMKQTGLKNIQILPCNPDTVHFYHLSGTDYSFDPAKIMPTTQQTEEARTYFTQMGFEVL